MKVKGINRLKQAQIALLVENPHFSTLKVKPKISNEVKEVLKRQKMHE
jgi:hypothetical protein